MRAKYKKELNKVSLTIETNQFYKEDFQMKMLRENHIHGLIKVECHHVNNESHFLYDVSNMFSLKKKFELVELNSEEMKKVIRGLMGVIDELQQYLLFPDCLLLDPNLIYWDKSKWNFLYLPIKSTNLSKAFHELTEYFVKTLDYSEIEGIKIASFLHKETLQENFNLKEALNRYEEYHKESEEDKKVEDRKVERGEAEEKLKRCSEGNEEETIREKGDYPDEMRGITIEDYQGESLTEREERGKVSKRFSFVGGKKSAKPKAQKNRWGDWEDMIIE